MEVYEEQDLMESFNRPNIKGMITILTLGFSCSCISLPVCFHLRLEIHNTVGREQDKRVKTR